MFYVELDELTAATGVDRQFDSDTPQPLAEQTTQRGPAEPAATAASANPESAVQDTPPAVKTVDMSVGNLDDDFDEFEDIQLDTSEIDRNIDFARHFPLTAEIEPPFDNDVSALPEERNTDTETGRMSDPDERQDGEKI
jgi:hypothetical protein